MVKGRGYSPNPFSCSGKGVYDPRAFILHAVLLRHPFGHCAIFPTAASRRSLARVSVPVWPCALSGRLPIVALVSHYPTNKLIGRGLLLRRPKPFIRRSYAVLAPLSQSYSPPKGRLPTCYSPVRHYTHTPKGAFSFDLHVLGAPPALILSRDQTLIENVESV